MDKKIKIYESEIKRSTRRKLMEKFVEEEYEMKDTYSKTKFKPTPKEKNITDVFGIYGEDMDPAVIRYIRKNPDKILKKLSIMYPEIYNRHIPKNINDLGKEEIEEVEEKKVTQKIYSPSEVKKATDEGIGIDVNGNVVPTKEGGLKVTSMDESKNKIEEKFASKAQQRYFYAMADKDTKKGKKFKKWAKEFSDDTDFETLPEKVSTDDKKMKKEYKTPIMKKGDLVEYIISKKNKK